MKRSLFSSFVSPGPFLAWDNLRQNLGQLGLAIVGIGFAVMLIFMQLGILGAVLKGAILLYEQLNFDIVLISPKSLEVSFTQPFSRQQLYRVTGLDSVASTASIYLSFADWQNPQNKQLNAIIVIACYPEEHPFKSPEINRQTRTLQQQETVLFNRLSSKDFGPQTIGTVTELKQRRVKIGGLFTMNNSFRFNGSILMSAENFGRYYPRRSSDDISLGLIRLRKGAELETTVTQIQALLPPNIRVLSRAEAELKDQNYWLTSTAIGTIVMFGAISAFLIGAVIVYQILNADVSERLPEYGTLKAMGYSNFQLSAIVLQQASILAVGGFILGFLLSLGIYQTMRSTTSLPVDMSLARIMLVFTLTIGMCNLSAWISLQKVIKFDPSDVFG